MESSFGVDIRHPWDLLGYSTVTYWYDKPGSTHNRPALPREAAKPIVSMEQAMLADGEVLPAGSGQIARSPLVLGLASPVVPAGEG